MYKMVNITISVPQETKDKLDLEDNKSRLITKLLNDHFKYNVEEVSELDLMIRDLEDKKIAMNNKIEEERQKLIRIKGHKEEEIKGEQELEEIKANKRRELENNVRNNAREIFDYTMSDNEIASYLEGDYPDLKTFIEGLKDANEPVS